MKASGFNVVIVGGGPAGSSAARTLAAAGINVCLIDKSFFPRDKLCGGLLTLRSKKAFQTIFKSDWAPVIQTVAKGANFYYKLDLLNSVTDHKDLFFTSRRDYDTFLLDLARKCGAVVIEGVQVLTIDIKRSLLELSDGRTVKYNFLIGADGINSVVAKTVFGSSFSQATVGFGLEMEVPVPSEVPRITAPEIYFGLLNWGYGWVFPKKETLTVGIGGLLGKNPGMRGTFERFLKQRFGRVPSAPIKGHFIPFGDFRKIPGRENILLCGDAAGLVEPITGEGIAFAMLSGFFAAEGIKEALAAAKPLMALEFYKRRHAAISGSLRQANFLRYLVFPKTSQRLFSKVLPRSKTLAQRHMDLMADDLTYGVYTGLLTKKLGSSLLKMLLPWQTLWLLVFIR